LNADICTGQSKSSRLVLGPRHWYLFVFLRPRVLKRIFLHYELDDMRGDILAIYILPALAIYPCGIEGGGLGRMHADVEDEGVCGLGVGKKIAMPYVVAFPGSEV